MQKEWHLNAGSDIERARIYEEGRDEPIAIMVGGGPDILRGFMMAAAPRLLRALEALVQIENEPSPKMRAAQKVVALGEARKALAEAHGRKI